MTGCISCCIVSLHCGVCVSFLISAVITMVTAKILFSSEVCVYHRKALLIWMKGDDHSHYHPHRAY